MAHFFQDAGRNPGNSLLVVDHVEREAIGLLIIEELDYAGYTAEEHVRLVIAVGTVLTQIDYLNLQTDGGHCGIEVDEDFLWLAERVLVSYAEEYARPGLAESYDLRPSPESLGMSPEDCEALNTDFHDLWETQTARYRAVINVTEALRPALTARAVA